MLGVLDADVVRSHAIAGLATLGAGVVEGARDLTAGYIRDRRQFGRALAEFQAVAQQIADVYIGSRTFTLTAGEVARRLDAGDPAADDLAVAAHWFADRASSVMQICQHLHGGMGVDETYAMPRYFASVRDIVRHLGGPSALADVPITETAGKNAELTAEERAFKQEARAYLTGLTSADDRDEMRTDRHGPAYHRIIKQMGADGWMGVGWPEEYGGQGRGGIEQQAFVNEASRADVHLPSVTLQTVGPTLQAYGTEKQKKHVPRRHRDRRRALRDRLQRARRRHRPRVDAHQCRARRRPLRRERPEDVDHRRSRRRLRLAGRAHRPRRVPAPGHLDPHRRHQATPATPRRPSSPATAPTTRTRRTSTTCGCRSTCSSARRTAAGS